MNALYKLMIIDFLFFSKKYLPASVAGAIILIAYCYVLRKYMDRKVKKIVCRGTVKYGFGYMITLFVFFIYLFMLICVAFLSREPGSRNAVRVELLYIFSKDIWARTYAIENIVLFIPFGFLLPRIFSRCNTFKWCMLAGMFSSVAMEVIQYVTKMGYSELDDVLNNTIGTMIGYGVLIMVRAIIGNFKKGQVFGIK